MVWYLVAYLYLIGAFMTISPLYSHAKKGWTPRPFRVAVVVFFWPIVILLFSIIDAIEGGRQR